MGVAGENEEIDKSGKRTLSETFQKIIPFKPPIINIHTMLHKILHYKFPIKWVFVVLTVLLTTNAVILYSLVA